MTDEHADDLDIWQARLNIQCGGYNSTIDRQIYEAAELLVAARESGDVVSSVDLANSLRISPEHAELIQYILASITMPMPDGAKYYRGCFSYGSSPRVLFVSDLGMAKQFLDEFEAYIYREWGNQTNDQ